MSTHPIQYNAPWFKLLAERKIIYPKIFYTWEQSKEGARYDPGFGKVIEWDVPLLDGYEYTFVRNVSKNPGTHHFSGINNPDLISEIEKWKPNGILVFGWSFVSHLKCIRHFSKKIPVFFRGDSTLIGKRARVTTILRNFFLKWVYKHIDYALYVGTNNKNYFLNMGLTTGQLIYAPHAVDNDRFAEPDDLYKQEAVELKQKAGIKETDLVILFSGKLESKKNPGFLIELAKKLPNENLRFVFVGNGDLETHLKEIAGNDKRIVFIDFKNQMAMPAVYRMGDIFILPSIGSSETWGLSANEAMASGCALILSDHVGGAIDLVHENKNGIVVNPKNIQKCKIFIDRLLQSKEELKEMKGFSRQLVMNFAFDRIVGGIEVACLNLKSNEF